MTQRIDRELAAMERRMTGVRLTAVRRGQAVSAMRTSLLIIEGLIGLGHKLTRIGSAFSAKATPHGDDGSERPAHP